jgi:hypothetical protein
MLVRSPPLSSQSSLNPFSTYVVLSVAKDPGKSSRFKRRMQAFRLKCSDRWLLGMKTSGCTVSDPSWGRSGKAFRPIAFLCVPLCPLW